MIGKYKIIAFITCRIHERECHEFISVLQKQLSETDTRLFVYNSYSQVSDGTEDNDPQTSVCNLIDPSFADVVIVHANRIENDILCQRAITRALDSGLHVISLGKSFPGCINIEYEHQSGISDMVDHLINSHGITDFHMIAGSKGNSYSEKRIEAFRNTIEKHGLPFEDSMISYGDFWSGPTIAAAKRLMEENRLPKAFVCANDHMAIAVSDFLQNNGISVPEDIAVTGYDRIETIYSSSPTIASASISHESVSKIIYDTLTDIFEGKEPADRISVFPEPVFNESCGCECSYRINSAALLNEQTNLFYRFQDENIVLSRVAEKIQQCGSFEEIAQIMRKDDLMYAMCCLIKREFTDETVNPEVENTNTVNNELYVLYDSDMIDYKKLHNEQFTPYYMTEKEIIPTLDYYLEDGRCLIFSALHYTGVSFGYVCFHFSDYIPGNYYKIPQTVNMLNNALGGLINLRHKHYLLKRIEKMSETDTLTGLYNRRGFCTEYNRLLENYPDEPFAVIMCDLDRLKHINDNFGHEEGDNAIHTVALALKNACPTNAVCTRFGGDEMMAVYPYKESGNNVRPLFEEYLNKYNSRSGKPYTVSASMGIYITPKGERLSFEKLVKNSDGLMYAEKKNRKSQFK